MNHMGLMRRWRWGIFLCLIASPLGWASASTIAPAMHAPPYPDVQDRTALCSLWFKIAATALYNRQAHWGMHATQRLLINRYAYGPNGEVYRDSSEIKSLIMPVVYRVYNVAPVVTQQMINTAESVCFDRAERGGKMIARLLSISPVNVKLKMLPPSKIRQ